MINPRISSTILSMATIAAAGLLASIFIFETPAQTPAGLRQDNFYYSRGKKIPLTISANRVGIVAEDVANQKDVKTLVDSLQNDAGFALLASSYRFKLTTAYPENLLIYSLSNVSRFSDVQKLALRIKGTGDQVKQAGLVATPQADTLPLIVTDEFIVHFKENISRSEIDQLNQQNNVEIVREDPFIKNQFLLRVKGNSPLDTLSLANFYYESGKAVYSHPNFIHLVETRQSFIPNDPLFINEWQHQNTGQGGGTLDADADTPLAWNMTRGNIVIAVIDEGYELGHPDLAPNLWVNTGEIPGNGVDDDDNGFVDDVNGYDFTDNDGDPRPGIDEDHGTAVAGVAAARGDNAIGVSGSCLNCRLMLIRKGANDFSTGQAFGYARRMGAQIITNSWGYPIGGTQTTENVENAIRDAARNGRNGLGTVIFFAMNNLHVNSCTGAEPDISSIPNVIAISRSTNMDRFDNSGFGNCMDLLAPTRSRNGFGTLGITTTDILGTPGFSIGDYADNFGGTSSATPLTAGVAGLMLSVDDLLSREQVQRLLQDTADKIEDSVGRYSDVTGFSAPAGGPATHGYGRINAFEAVRISAPVATGGRGGVDVFLRDNRLDWGNTEQPSSVTFETVRGVISPTQSMDIKVDAPPYQPAPANSVAFDAFTDENVRPGVLNKVYVRVRNRGPVAATGVTVKLHWAYGGAGSPALPADFWSVFPANSSNTSIWHPLGSQVVNVPYSGCSLAGSNSDAAQIISFGLNGPAATGNANEDICLFVVLDAEQDRALPRSRPAVSEDLIPDRIVPRDNNISQRNVKLESSAP